MSDYNPYAPPEQDGAAPDQQVSGIASWDGKFLTVPQRFSFPRICLKCASPEVTARRTQKFSFTPTWARLLVVVCWPAAVVAMAITSKRATLELPLCTLCDAKWRSARRLSLGLVLAMLVAILGISFMGEAMQSLDAGPIALFAVPLALVTILVVFRKVVMPRMLQVKKVDDLSVTLIGVSSRAGEQVARAQLG